jgi:hypothetical protein
MKCISVPSEVGEEGFFVLLRPIGSNPVEGQTAPARLIWFKEVLAATLATRELVQRGQET